MGSDLEWDKNEWLETSWGKIVELKYGKSLKGYKGAEGAFPVYGTNGPVGFCDKPLCAFPSVIVGRKGAYRGIHYSLKPFYVIDTAYYMTPLIDINLKWAYYFLLTKDINGLDSGSAIPSTRREDFYALPAKVPPRKTQDALVQCLDFFNNKIELNRQINQTLEQMAQTLFKSWFVDFDPVFDNLLAKANYQLDNLPADFPEELHPKAVTRLAALSARIPTQEHENEKLASIHDRDNATLPYPDFPSEFEFNEQLGWVPLGWGGVPLSEVIKFSNGKSHKGLANGQYPLYGANGIIGSVNEFKFNNGIIIGRVGAYCGAIEYCAKSFWPSDNTIVATPKAGKKLNPYILNLLNNLKLNQYAGGAAQPLLNQTTLGRICIPNVSVELLLHFSLIVGEQLKKIVFNNIQNDSLTKLRDTLLPKLISGELQVPDLEPRSHALRGNA